MTRLADKVAFVTGATSDSGRYTGSVELMVAPHARARTLRLVPRSGAGA